jgi:hypothetical protein
MASEEPSIAGGWQARTIVGAWAAALAVLAIGLHVPGQVSYDSSIQLLEAAEGVSRSWNPPFMSALLQALGGGTSATTAFVVLCAALTYAGLALAVPSLRAGGNLGRIAAALLAVGNPVIVLYAGIVWKDVLLGALLSLACGACLAATGASTPARRWALALLSAAALVVGAHVRQQGLFLLPLLAVVPLLAVHGDRRPSLAAVAAWLLGVALAFVAIGQWTASRIAHEDGWDRERGAQRILAFDIVGTLALSDTTRAHALAAGLGGMGAVREAYDPSRVDAIRRAAPVAARFDDVETAALRALWGQAIGADPGAYLRHRAGVAAHVLGIASLERCLPMHVGVAGSAHALEATGLREGVDARGNRLYAAARALYDTPWFRHWCALLALAAIAVLAVLRRRDPTMRVASWFALAGIAYAMATTAFAIACDFRYLYPVVTMGSACAIAVVCHSGVRPGPR